MGRDDMNQQELNEELFNLQRRLQLQERYIFEEDWFRLDGDQVVMYVDISLSSDTQSRQIYVPNFVNYLIINCLACYETSESHTIHQLKINGQQLKEVNAREVRVQYLQVTGMEEIKTQMFSNITVLDRLQIDSTPKYIGSYAFNIGQQCILDIRRCTETVFDSRFVNVYVKNVMYDRRGILGQSLKGEAYELNGKRLKRQCEIWCTEQQYKQLKQNKQFKYKQKLKVTE